ncbi:hypothetical protein [Devosia elaeis]|uniref:Uncharacterized protein n=1 Tax=Devosia elaeis TaxID=1770058 RepID=A0A178I752_9HYPH|nr:hypothetical protein [Devosia elaeis]OAM84207.1 hypothetical protein A3840_00045 [Devosia elaeis]
MSRELDDDELRALLDRISAERATMKPGEYPEEQPMTDAASPSPSEMDELSERLLSAATDIERAFLHRIDHSGEDWRLVNPDGETAAAIMREAQSALAAMRAERDRWEQRFFKMDRNFDRAVARAETAEAQVLRLTEENEALRKRTGPDMWCQSCGTVTRDDECDCNRFGEVIAEQRLVNLADELGRIAREEMEKREAAEVRIKALEEALGDVLSRVSDTVGCGRHCVIEAEAKDEAEYTTAIRAARTTLQKEQADG